LSGKCHDRSATIAVNSLENVIYNQVCSAMINPASEGIYPAGGQIFWL
jgi:hypothetical protein